MAQSIFIALLSLEGRYMDSRQNAIIDPGLYFQNALPTFPAGDLCPGGRTATALRVRWSGLESHSHVLSESLL